ncbi:hypothetical protein GCM10025871_31980 [Deinococcus metallilatus]|nr:hypothetical protein GCM10025871_31980 [Deinococcus metallilatus]
MRPAIPWAAWEESIRTLTELGQVEAALLSIERAIPELQDAAQGAALLALLDTADAGGRLGRAALRMRLRLWSNVPGGAAEVERLAGQALEHGPPDAFLQVFLAWALAQREAYAEALSAAERALLHEADLRPNERTLAWRMKGLSLNRTQPDGPWEAAFAQALQGTEGHARALILIDLGGLHSRRGDEAGAMMAFSEALPLVRQPRYRAWTLNSMGLICLRAARLDEAETYFQQLARLPGAFQSRALSGQAGARRALGEWARAGTLYEQAAAVARAAGDEDDLRQALRGLGHTQRLAGHLLLALDTLRQASRVTAADRASGRSWVNVDLAATLVGLPALDAASVRDHLARVGPLDREDGDRALIVGAELDRREGRTEQARAALGGLDRSVLWVREEAQAFPLLFGLLSEQQRPAPLPRPPQTRVVLRVLGLPEVQVNGRRVPLPDLALVMLAALVEAGGELTTDELTEVLRDHRPRTARLAAQRVSRTARQLRDALGWPGSVQAQSGRYRLDPDTAWASDLDAARREGREIEVFLSGVSLPWATEREQELRQQDTSLLT